MAAALGDLNQCSVCFFTSDDFEFFLRHLCVDDNGNIAPPDAPIRKLKTNQNDLNNRLLMHGSILPVTIPPRQPRGQVQPFGPGGGELFEAVLSRGEGGGANRK